MQILFLLIQTIMIFLATEIDDFIVFVFLYSKNNSKKSRIVIFLSQLIILLLLTAGCIFIASLLSRIPQKYTRLSGIIPIIIGIISIIKKEDDKDDSAGKNFGLFITSALTVLISSSDNICVYIPFFLNMFLWQKISVLLIFTLLQSLWSFLQIKAANLPLIQKIVTKAGKVLEPVIFILLGLIILFDIL